MNTAVFWNVSPSKFVDRYQRSCGKFFLQLQDETHKIETINLLETLVSVYQSWLHHIQQERNSRAKSNENAQSHKY